MRLLSALGPLAIAMAFALPQAAGAQTPIPFVEHPCEPEGSFDVICGQRHPEDLFRVPDANWILASWYDEAGGLRAINAEDRQTVRLFPAPTARERHDRETFAECPGPPSARDTARVVSTGVTVGPQRNGTHRVYLIRHGLDSSAIEAFELDLRGEVPFVTWVGCVPVPPGSNLNSVTPTPEGGLIASNFNPGMYSADPAAARQRMEAGGINGGALEWRPGQGWQEVPGSEASGANGVELSEDGRWLYVNAWGRRSIMRLSRGTDSPERVDMNLGFRGDNLHWAPDGSLLTAGLGDGGTAIARIDPTTLEVTRLGFIPDSPTFSGGTVAAQVGDMLWIGTFRSDRIVLVPVPR